MPQQPAISPLGVPFVELQSVDSTNNYALDRVHAGLAQHGQAFFAHEQVAGKGQRGRVWTAEKDANIILSVVAKPYPLLIAQQFQLVAAVSLAVHDFFAKYAGDATKIKWPNDLYWQDRKAGGILIESVIGGSASVNGERASMPVSQWQWAVIGIGININQTSFPSQLKNPVSLKQITGKEFDVVELARELCISLNNRFTALLQNGFEKIYPQYQRQIYKKGEVIKLKKDNRVFEVMIKGVSSTGQLIVQHSMEEEFDFGDVEWLLNTNE